MQYIIYLFAGLLLIGCSNTNNCSKKLDKAKAYIAKGRNDLAYLILVEIAREENNCDAEAQVLIGDMYAFGNDYYNGLKEYKKAVDFNSKDTMLTKKIAYCFMQQNMYDSAYFCLMEKYSLPITYNIIGKNYVLKGMEDSAKKYFLWAMYQFPNESESYNNLSMHYAKKQMYDSAFIYIDKAIELSPTTANFYLNKGSYLYATNNYYDALAYVNMGIKYAPDDTTALKIKFTIEETIAKFLKQPNN